MKKVSYRIVCVMLLVLSIFLILNKAFSSYGDYNTAAVYRKIQEGENIDLLMMGNSQLYTNVNAKAMSELLDKDVYILSSNAQNMEMALANLKTVLKYTRPKRIVLEEYVIMIDSSKNLNNASIGMAYANVDSIDNLFEKYKNVRHYLDKENILSALFPLLRSGDMYSRYDNLFKKESLDDYLNSDDFLNGSSFRETFGTLNEDTIEKAAQNYIELREKYTEIIDVLPERSVKAFKEFLDLCAKEGIEVTLIKAPAIKWDVQMYLEYMQISDLVKGYANVKVLENALSEYEQIGLNKTDFYDDGHMSVNGNRKYTYFLAKQFCEYYDYVLNDNDYLVLSEDFDRYEEDSVYRVGVLNKDVKSYRFIITDEEDDVLLDVINENGELRTAYDVITYESPYSLKIIVSFNSKEKEFVFLKNKGATIR